MNYSSFFKKKKSMVRLFLVSGELTKLIPTTPHITQEQKDVLVGKGECCPCTHQSPEM